MRRVEGGYVAAVISPSGKKRPSPHDLPKTAGMRTSELIDEDQWMTPVIDEPFRANHPTQRWLRRRKGVAEG